MKQLSRVRYAEYQSSYKSQPGQAHKGKKRENLGFNPGCNSLLVKNPVISALRRHRVLLQKLKKEKDLLLVGKFAKIHSNSFLSLGTGVMHYHSLWPFHATCRLIFAISSLVLFASFPRTNSGNIAAAHLCVGTSIIF